MDIRLIELSIKSLPEKKKNKNNNSSNNNNNNNSKTFVFTVLLQPWLLSAAAAPKIVIIATAINATPTSVSIPTFQQSQIKPTPCWWLYNRQPEASISHADRTAELFPMLYTTTLIIWHEPELREPKVNGPFSNRFESKLKSSTGAGSVQCPDSPFWQNRTANG